MRTLGTILILATVALAGCLGSMGTTEDPTGQLAEPTEFVAREDPLWDAAQTFPHPDYGYPTLTNPAEEVPNPWWKPVEGTALPEDVTGLDHQVNDPGAEGHGAGIALFGRLAIVPSWAGKTTIFDITDPEDPQQLSTLKLGDEGQDAIPARDVDTIAYPSGRLLAVFATDDGVVPVWDITDPTEPERLGLLHPTDGSHNVNVVPGTPILYNSNSQGGKTNTAAVSPDEGTGITEIYKLSEERIAISERHTFVSLDEATHVRDWGNGYGCHDIGFHVTGDKQRAYCAGHEYTQIWDIADPVSPSVVVNVPVHHGTADGPSVGAAPARFSHLAMVDQDASVLIVGDETGGGVAPGCDAHAEAAGQSVSGPVGNLYFYDISDEEDPQLEGWISPSQHYPTNPPHDDTWTPYSPSDVPPGCTAHFGRIVPQEGRDLLAIAFYGAGVNLVDFSNPANPSFVDRWAQDTNTWDVWFYDGYLVTGDLARGMDVLTLS